MEFSLNDLYPFVIRLKISLEQTGNIYEIKLPRHSGPFRDWESHFLNGIMVQYSHKTKFDTLGEDQEKIFHLLLPNLIPNIWSCCHLLNDFMFLWNTQIMSKLGKDLSICKNWYDLTN